MRRLPWPAGLPATTLLGVAAVLAGCASVDADGKHAALDPHTHISEPPFLDPAPAHAKTIYLGLRNTSDLPDIDLRTPLAQAIAARGYTIVDDPDAAQFSLQANVLQAGRLQAGQQGALLAAGYGEPLLGGAAAGGLTAALTRSAEAGLGAGLGAAAASWAISQAYQDVTYTITADVQITQRRPFGAAQQARSTRPRVQTVAAVSEAKHYRLRDVAYADRVNLRQEEAMPVLVAHLTSSLANLFE